MEELKSKYWVNFIIWMFFVMLILVFAYSGIERYVYVSFGMLLVLMSWVVVEITYKEVK